MRSVFSRSAVIIPGALLFVATAAAETRSYPIVDTGQVRCYDDAAEIAYPKEGKAFFGQDAHYAGNLPSYRDNGDGTVADLVTGLMWTKDPGEKKSFRNAVKGASECRAGGYKDWRLPSIKELYSLILFSGVDPDPGNTDASGVKPFIDTSVFSFCYGDTRKGERMIDAQFATSTKYVHKTMRGDETVFGVNFADGRIKGYPMTDPRGRGDKTFFVLYVRGNTSYGKNALVDNKDGTVSDKATGLMWMQIDSGHLNAGKRRDGGLDWGEALDWAEDLTYAGHSDWRIPNAKELQSIVDYSRSPATTESAAIAGIFKVSTLSEQGQTEYPYYWTSTTHVSERGGSAAAYIAFGKGLGWMSDRRSGQKVLMDVHGAGCQRSDPKSGDPERFPYGRGPQGDVLRIYNSVRCVRGGNAVRRESGPDVGIAGRPQPAGKKGVASAFMKREDRNGDGKVSSREFRGPKKHFSQLDKNGDGYISESEAPSGPPPGPRR